MEKGRKGQHGLSEKGDRGGWAAPWTCTPAGEGRKERGGSSEKEGRGARLARRWPSEGVPLAVGGGAGLANSSQYGGGRVCFEEGVF